MLAVQDRGPLFIGQSAQTAQPGELEEVVVQQRELGPKLRVLAGHDLGLPVRPQQLLLHLRVDPSPGLDGGHVDEGIACLKGRTFDGLTLVLPNPDDVAGLLRPVEPLAIQVRQSCSSTSATLGSRRTTGLTFSA